MKYSEIRTKYQSKQNLMLVDIYACVISPLVTKLLLRTSITPNYTTILMMISGIIGAAFFVIPNDIVKIIGLIFIHLWYVLDCCDGEIARINKKYSVFGREIDYTAHILNHPIFAIAFAIALIQRGVTKEIVIAVFMLAIVSNLIFRNLLLFNTIYESKMNEINIEKNEKRNIVKKIIDNMIIFPNFAIIFPVVYLVNYKIAYMYTILFTSISLIVVYLKLFNWIKKIVKL